MRLYRRLVQAGPATTEDLAAVLGLPVAEVERLVKALAHRGLLSLTAGGPGLSCALPPQVAVESLIQRREQELSRARRALASLVAEHSVASGVSPAGPVELLDGPGLARRWAEVEASVEREMLVLARVPFVRHTDRTREVLGVLERRVDCRCVYDRSALDQPGSLRAISQFHAVLRVARHAAHRAVEPGLAPLSASASLSTDGLLLRLETDTVWIDADEAERLATTRPRDGRQPAASRCPGRLAALSGRAEADRPRQDAAVVRRPPASSLDAALRTPL
ncbi:hypothetical protein [Micromonospora sp. CB01531]|uniref:hypothetical protein n=1 Tax=Micromonospora sp. CB01531 TaxID=1718947 RepID=UPI001160FC70|nr:hypothetical protein [Micromonospora sp. CB01531]